MTQFYFLKLEKRINALKKVYEDSAWGGNESIKLIEKQDIGIILVLRSLIAVAETLQSLFTVGSRAIKIEAERFNNLLSLLLYCDNLEINYLVLKFVSIAEQ